MALGVGPGDEVVTTAFSFFATAGAVARLGAVPVFVDVEPDTYNICPQALRESVTGRTKAIIPVHLFGQCADMDPILEFALSRGIPVVEDAAQAIGAEYRGGRRAGSMGATGCFSFFPSKNLGAWGDAGLVTTNDPAVADTLRLLRVHGARPKYHHKVLGGNFRLDTLQAAVLNVKLEHLDGWTRKRQDNADFYLRTLAGTGDLRLPRRAWGACGLAHDHIFHQFILRSKRRSELLAFLDTRGIATEVYYPVPLNAMECFAYLGVGTRCPEAAAAARETFAIPVHSELEPSQRERVTAAIKEFFS
jgi:dTDP-4-amino-4,6-dideoxygalactose transaminase